MSLELSPTPTDGYPTATSEQQLETEESITNLILSTKTPLTLNRQSHLSWIARLFFQGFPAKYTSQDASQPWLLYWVTQSFQVLGAALDAGTQQKAIDTIMLYQSSEGGFAGGPGQFPHLLPTYASVSVLAIVGRPGPGGGWDQIDRQKMYRFFMSLKQRDGSFIVSQHGEVDIRGTYCLLVVATLLDLLTPELLAGTSGFISSMQTYEGGFASASQPHFLDDDVLLDHMRPPLGEAHGGYTSCALASWAMLLASSDPTPASLTDPAPSASSSPTIDLRRLLRWMALMQGSNVEGGGFRGRTNKLVDGCYSWWVGGAFSILESLLPVPPEELDRDGQEDYQHGEQLPSPSSSSPSAVVDPAGPEPESGAGDDSEWSDDDQMTGLYNRHALQEYILIAAQAHTGGLRDKPGKAADTYHTLYNLAGLSSAQHRVYLSQELQMSLEGKWTPNPGFYPEGMPHEGSEQKNARRMRVWSSARAWKEQESASRYVGGQKNRVNATHPVFNLTITHVKGILNHFYGQQD